MALSSDSSRGLHLAVLVLALSLCAVVGLSHAATCGLLPLPLARALRFLTSCPFRALTGVACPLCGTVTAFLHLLRGDLISSLFTNPIAVGLVPTLLIQLVYRSFRLWRPAFLWRQEALVAALCLVAWLSVWRVAMSCHG